jgi:N-acetyl sugar amidotransferase
MVNQSLGDSMEFQNCNNCLMDPTATDWEPRGFGCNYCQDYTNKFGNNFHIKQNFLSEHEVDKILRKFAEKIKQRSFDSKYDCVVGLSGGLDSTYALHLAVQAGLRVMAVHMDNGWNSELAQNNIEGIVQKTGVDFETNVLDWATYQKMQEAFLDADVVDIEMLYDHAAIATCFALAKKHSTKTIIAGTNSATEGMRMPPTWSWINKYDELNIRDIWYKFGDGTSIEKFPFYSTFDHYKDIYFHGFTWESIIDLLPYSKSNVEELLKKEYGYQSYPYKHYESIFTRFYQGYILPQKFGVDKRKNHLSTLLLNGEITREMALQILTENPYPSMEDLQRDTEYFLKKMNWTAPQLTDYLNRPPASHYDFNTDEKFLKYFRKIDHFIYRTAVQLNKYVNSLTQNLKNNSTSTSQPRFGHEDIGKLRLYSQKFSKKTFSYFRKILQSLIKRLFFLFRKFLDNSKKFTMYLLILSYNCYRKKKFDRSALK